MGFGFRLAASQSRRPAACHTLAPRTAMTGFLRVKWRRATVDSMRFPGTKGEREIISSECCYPAHTSIDLNVTFQARNKTTRSRTTGRVGRRRISLVPGAVLHARAGDTHPPGTFPGRGNPSGFAWPGSTHYPARIPAWEVPPRPRDRASEPSYRRWWRSSRCGSSVENFAACESTVSTATAMPHHDRLATLCTSLLRQAHARRDLTPFSVVRQLALSCEGLMKWLTVCRQHMLDRSGTVPAFSVVMSGWPDRFRPSRGGAGWRRRGGGE